MARVSMIEKEGASEPVLRVYEGLEKNRGAIHNFYKVLAHKPQILRNLGPFMEAVHGPEGIVDVKLKEKIAIRVAQVNGSGYWLNLLREEARQLGISDEELDELADLGSARHLNSAGRAALRYIESITRYPEGVSDETFAELQQHFTIPQIVEITYQATLHNFLNRFSGALEIDPD